MAAACLALAGTAANAQKSEKQIDARALAVFERTKTTTATYALYSWNWVQDPEGNIRSEWAAEFHDGALHRVETPAARLVANCLTGDGTIYDVASGDRWSEEWVAKAACGINSNIELRALEWVGQADSRFGPLETIRLIDAVNTRYYVVDTKGVLIASEYFSRHDHVANCLQSEPLAVESRLPRDDLFTEASLEHSAVPEKFRQAPVAPSGVYWHSARRCP